MMFAQILNGTYIGSLDDHPEEQKILFGTICTNPSHEAHFLDKHHNSHEHVRLAPHAPLTSRLVGSLAWLERSPYSTRGAHVGLGKGRTGERESRPCVFVGALAPVA